MEHEKIKARWVEQKWRKYVGEDNEWLDSGHIYLGNYLIFEQATLVFIPAKQKVFQTLTKNWEDLEQCYISHHKS